MGAIPPRPPTTSREECRRAADALARANRLGRVSVKEFGQAVARICNGTMTPSEYLAMPPTPRIQREPLPSERER